MKKNLRNNLKNSMSETTSMINRKAWEIRRAKMEKYRCKLMNVVWRFCWRDAVNALFGEVKKVVQNAVTNGIGVGIKAVQKFACIQKYFKDGRVDAQVFRCKRTEQPRDEQRPGYDLYVEIFDSFDAAEQCRLDAIA